MSYLILGCSADVQAVASPDGFSLACTGGFAGASGLVAPEGGTGACRLIAELLVSALACSVSLEESEQRSAASCGAASLCPDFGAVGGAVAPAEGLGCSSAPEPSNFFGLAEAVGGLTMLATCSRPQWAAQKTFLDSADHTNVYTQLAGVTCCWHAAQQESVCACIGNAALSMSPWCKDWHACSKRQR